MGAITTIRLPRLGETMEEGKITALPKQPGDFVRRGETLLEVETDKTVVEVPALMSGRLLEWLVSVDSVVAVDGLIARMDVEDGGVDHPPVPADEGNGVSDRMDAGAAAPEHAASAEPPRQPPAQTRLFATPVARRLARRHGVSIDGVTGTGRRGRITRDDVLASVSQMAVEGHDQAGGSPRFRGEMVDTSMGSIRLRRWHPVDATSPVTAVLLHGLFADIESWTQTAAGLARMGVPSVAFDLPFHGESRAVVGSVDDIARCLTEAVSKSVGGPVVLVGHSLGGMIATKIAVHPDLDVGGLVLIAPVGLGEQINTAFLTNVLSASTGDALGQVLDALTVRGIRPSDATLTTSVLRLQENSKGLEVLLQELAPVGVQQISIAADLAGCTMPVSILWGRRDTIVPWHHVLSASPDVAIHLFDDVGHMPQWEAAQMCLRILRSKMQGWP